MKLEEFAESSFKFYDFRLLKKKPCKKRKTQERHFTWVHNLESITFIGGLKKRVG